MTDKQVMTRIRRIIKPWISTLGLDRWDITIELAPDDALGQVSGSNIEAAADCEAVWQYERAVIRFSDTWARRASESDLEETVVHELLHCTLNEMNERKPKHEERVATVLTRALMKTAGKAA